MNRKRIPLVVLGGLLAGGLLRARPASGAESTRQSGPNDDFTFNVPVELHAITGGAVGGLVSCTALSVVPPAAPAPPGGESLGMGGATFTLTNGSYQGTVTVHAGLRPGKKIEDAKGYQCNLWFRTASGQEKLASDSSFGHKQGAPYVLDVRGPINP